MLPALSSARILNPRFLSQPAAYDVASNTCLALLRGHERLRATTWRVPESFSKDDGRAWQSLLPTS
jgi:hypothetical protein